MPELKAALLLRSMRYGGCLKKKRSIDRKSFRTKKEPEETPFCMLSINAGLLVPRIYMGTREPATKKQTQDRKKPHLLLVPEIPEVSRILQKRGNNKLGPSGKSIGRMMNLKMPIGRNFN